jgi:hypothetical protein
MSTVLGRRGVALLLATTLALVSAGPAAAAQPTGEWMTYFATDTLPAGTWPVGIYNNTGEDTDNPFFVLHTTWTLPAPGGDQFDPLPRGSYEVSTSAPLYPGTVIFAGSRIPAVEGGTRAKPLCSQVTVFNPNQPTRFIMVMTLGTAVTRSEYQREMATTTLTAALNDGTGRTLAMKPIKTEPLAETDRCQFSYRR